MAQEPQLSLPLVGRNDPCPCGSGKKYKKCCLPKHQAEQQAEQAAAQASAAQAEAEAKVLRDDWMPGRDYVAAGRYPLTRFDQFFLEILNVIGGAVHECTGWDQPHIGTLLASVMAEGRRFYSGCWTCKHHCLKKPMSKVSLQSLVNKGLQLEDFPDVLQRPLALNFFYFEFVNSLLARLGRELSDALSEEQADDVVASAYDVVIGFLTNNCWMGCDNQCIREPGKNGYCGICTFTTGGLPCPQKGEISYVQIATFPDEMLH